MMMLMIMVKILQAFMERLGKIIAIRRVRLKNMRGKLMSEEQTQKWEAKNRGTVDGEGR